MTQLNPENNPGTHPEIPVEHMPPLEPTADVPVINRDTVNSDPNWHGVQETFHGRTAIPPIDQSDNVLTGARTAEEERGERAKKNKGHMVVIGAVAAGAAITASAFFGFNKLTSSPESKPPTPEKSPVATAPVTPGESHETETGVNDFGISVEKYPTADLAIRAYFEKLREYYMSAPTYDEPGDPKRLEALMGVNWESNSELDEWGNGMREFSIPISTNYFITSSETEEQYKYKYSMDVTDITDIVETPTTVAGLATLHEYDNAMDTVIGSASQTSANMDVIGQIHITLTKEGDYWVQTEVDNLNNN